MVRVAFVIILAILIVALIVCAVKSYRSEKPIAKRVFLLELSLVPAVLGNLVIMASTTKGIALLGCYTYYIGMDIIMLAFLGFSKKYCMRGNNVKKKYAIPVWMYGFLVADILQLALNPFFGHAFRVEQIEAYGAPYYRLVPLEGQTFHRIVVYGTVFMIMLVYAMISVKMAKINKEKYVVVLISLIITTIWQTFYIVSRAPVDRSMVGFGVFGILIYYFSLHYRPVRLLDQMLADIISDMREAVFLFDATGDCIWTNEPGQILTGVNENTYELAKLELKDLFGDYESLTEKTHHSFVTGSDTDSRCYVLERGVFKDEKGRMTGSFLNVRDNTADQMRLEREMYDATHDTLTNLYTKEYLYQKISELLLTGKKEDYLIGFIDVRDFKIVNDIFGKEFGDYALRCVADWIRDRVPEDSIYGRLIGDTFGVCRPKKTYNPEVVEAQLSEFVIKKANAEYHLELNIGFCEIGEEDTDISILFDRAHLAVNSIRDDYTKHVAFYDSSIREKVRRDQEISAQIHGAILDGQIIPYLQPIADSNGKIVGAEALVRWIHPEQGFMSPGEFIPVFEENGMIVDVDKHIWHRVCEILSGWKDKYPDLFVSVNISPKDFYLTDVFENIMGMVKEFDIDQKNLRIEVTETSMMTDIDDKMRILDKFRENGIIVEMDDFGSGYSSLNMLKDMPVDVLKIDMKFLGRSKDNDRAETIVKNVIHLSEDLGMESLTEGVETVEQFEMLKSMGCKLFQGYYFSKPLLVEEFEALLKG